MRLGAGTRRAAGWRTQKHGRDGARLEAQADGDVKKVEIEDYQGQVHAVTEVGRSRQRQVQQKGQVPLCVEYALLSWSGGGRKQCQLAAWGLEICEFGRA